MNGMLEMILLHAMSLVLLACYGPTTHIVLDTHTRAHTAVLLEVKSLPILNGCCPVSPSPCVMLHCMNCMVDILHDRVCCAATRPFAVATILFVLSVLRLPSGPFLLLQFTARLSAESAVAPFVAAGAAIRLPSPLKPSLSTARWHT